MEIKVQKKDNSDGAPGVWIDDQTIFTVSDDLRAAVDATKDFDSLVQAYIIARDAKEQIKRITTEWSAPIDGLMTVIESKFKEMLDATGQESAKTASGTVYKTLRTSAKVADWNVLLAYIIKHDAYDLLTKNVSKDAAKARMEETGEIVPGVDFVRFIDVGVRRA